MDTPWNNHTGQAGQPIHFDVSPERLDSLPSSELADEMERALDAMTEDTYDASVIDAYLEALDRRAPMPEHPDAERAYVALQEKLQTEVKVQGQVSASPTPLGRGRGILRAGLVAAITIACLFGGMVAAQAVGVDVFGALARWTESAFSFGPIQSGEPAQGDSDPAQQADLSNMPAELPAEYQELWSELAVRGISDFMFPTYIPDGFQVEGSDLYISSESDRIDFSVWYVNGDNDISFGVSHGGNSSTVYEKDNQDVEIYEHGDTIYYIFSNNGRSVATWYANNIEYSLRTSLAESELQTMLDLMYVGVTE